MKLNNTLGGLADENGDVMRYYKTSSHLRLSCFSGTYVVTLGWDLKKDNCEGLLGFSIHRVDQTENEAYFLEAMKCFKETDPGFPAGSLYSTQSQPIQSFQWADYSAKPGHSYTYTVTALKGSPDNLTPFDAVSINVDTENTDAVHHNVYFNRGAAASQEYERRFGDKRPEEVPNDAAFIWLSRGLWEAMTDFVKSAKPGQNKLRIAAYEFNHPPFLELLKQCVDAGVDIKIVYDDRQDDPGLKNVAAIRDAHLGSVCKPRKKGASYISHNKFMVLLDGDDPVSVWTGGTNFSTGGIFGHSNVAHVVKDSTIAKKYLEYWTDLHSDPESKDLKPEVEALTPLPTNEEDGARAIFSPRKNLDALTYYGDLATGATEGLFMTFAFGMNQVFKSVYRNCKAPLRMGLFETKVRAMKKGPDRDAELAEFQAIRNLPENVFAVGGFITTNKIDGWVKEHLSGLNPMVKYIHNKFMLVDPLSDDPVVIAGSANFSDASTKDNDENMLVVRGNARVADIYLGEFMRLYSHFAFRESLQWRDPGDKPKFLRTDDWWKDYFIPGERSTRRQFFSKKRT